MTVQTNAGRRQRLMGGRRPRRSSQVMDLELRSSRPANRSYNSTPVLMSRERYFCCALPLGGVTPPNREPGKKKWCRALFWLRGWPLGRELQGCCLNFRVVQERGRRCCVATAFPTWSEKRLKRERAAPRRSHLHFCLLEAPGARKDKIWWRRRLVQMHVQRVQEDLRRGSQPA